MYKNINVDKKAVEAGIAKLKQILDNIDSETSLTGPVEDIQGSGEIIDLINEINAMYKQIVEDYKVLLNNSVLFFENVIDSISKHDELAGQYFK